MGQQKILHIHDSDLDDPRIISAANTGKKAGYELHFCGVKTDTRIKENLFSSYHWFEINHQAQVATRMPHAAPLWEAIGRLHPTLKKYGYPFPHFAMWVEKQITKIINEVKPDIIHAHNIISAHYAQYSGIPIIVDDHEYLSLHTKALDEDVTTKKSLAYRIAGKRWAEWEQELGEKYPVVTVSEPIADYWRKFSKHVYTLPNYLNRDTVQLTGVKRADKAHHMVSVYLGTDNPLTRQKSVRNITGLDGLFEGNGTGKLLRIGVDTPNTDYIKSVGRVPIEVGWKYMMDEGHIGLLPWQKHWFHPYCSPNKVGEYAHCGLWVIVPSDATFVIKEFASHCDTFETYADLKERIEYYNHNRSELDTKRQKLLEHAREHLVWEKFENGLLEAYKNA